MSEAKQEISSELKLNTFGCTGRTLHRVSIVCRVLVFCRGIPKCLTCVVTKDTEVVQTLCAGCNRLIGSHLLPTFA